MLVSEVRRIAAGSASDESTRGEDFGRIAGDEVRA